MVTKLMQFKKHLPLALLVASGSMAVAGTSLMVQSVGSHREIESLLARTESALAAPKATETKTEEKKDATAPEGAEVASAVKDPFKELVNTKHLFGSDNLGLSVKAILGESILVNDKWIKLGEEVDGIKLVSLESNKAVVQVRDQKVDLAVWNTLPGTEAGAPLTRLIGWNSSPEEKSKHGKRGSYRREYMVSMNESGDNSGDGRMKQAREARENYKRKRDDSRRERSAER